jgi:hypothetical protein
MRVGAQTPRLSHVPAFTRNDAAEDVIVMARVAGMPLDPWQEWVVRNSLGELDDDRWAAFEAALIVPRQCGKSALIEALILAALFVWREQTVIYSAHLFATAQETFTRLRSLIENSEFADEVAKVYTANGKESIILKNGCRVKFMARSRGGGRGFSGDRIIFDEAYDLAPTSIGAMVPTLAARSMRGESNPQIWYASSAPHVDSVVLHSIRKRAQSEAPGRLFFAEWSAPDDASADDVDAWYQANPALGIRISEDFVRDERAALMHSPQEFLRERLGIVETQAGGGAIPLDQWQRLTDADSNIVGPLSIALDVSPDREWASFAAAGKRADDVDHVEIIDRRPGTGWVVDRAAELASKWSTSITLDPSSPAGGLLGDLQSAGVSVAEVSQRSHAQACGALVDAVRNESLRHLGQPSLLAALTGAQKRTTGDVWMWSRTGSHVDITPLVAATLALWASRTAAPPKLTHSASAFVSLDDY